MAALAGSIARRYARALFAIGVDKRNFEALGKELDAMAALWNQAADIRQSLSNPIFKLSQKRRWHPRARCKAWRSSCWNVAVSRPCPPSRAPTKR